MIAPPRNVLCSFHYFKEYDLDRLPNLRIIGDSGAFSARSQGAEILTPDLAAWAKKWRHRLLWVAALDVIGNPKATRRNWKAMVEEGVPGVPTIHFGEEPSEMDWYAERGVDFLGLGGLVGIPLPRQMRWLIKVFKYAQANHPEMRFHGWGVTADRALHLPFYSVDSSGWTAAVRYGRLKLRHPTDPRLDQDVALNGRDVYRPEVMRLLRQHYGTRLDEAATSSSVNRETMVRLSALSASVHEMRFRKRHGTISAPTWGRLDKSLPSGPAHHLADADPKGFVVVNAIGEALAGPAMHLANTDPGQFETVNKVAAGGPSLHLATARISNASPDAVQALHDREGPAHV